jgi:hypothetical protein
MHKRSAHGPKVHKTLFLSKARNIGTPSSIANSKDLVYTKNHLVKPIVEQQKGKYSKTTLLEEPTEQCRFVNETKS